MPKAFKTRKRRRPAYTRVRRPLGKRQAQAVATIARKQISRTSEWKHHTLALQICPSDAGVIQDLSAVPQGDTDTSRDGDTIFATSVQIRGLVNVADSHNQYRVIIFQWTPSTTPVIADILNLSTGHHTRSMYETDKANEYKILYDRVFLMVSSSGDAVKQFNTKIRLSRRKIQFIAGGTSGTRKVYMLVVSDSAAATHPCINCVAKLNYRDG